MAATVNGNTPSANANAQLDAAGAQSQEQYESEIELKKKLAQKGQHAKTEQGKTEERTTAGKGITSFQPTDLMGAAQQGQPQNDLPKTALMMEHGEAGTAAVAAAFEPLVALLPDGEVATAAPRFAAPQEVHALPFLTPLLTQSLQPTLMLALDSIASHPPVELTAKDARPFVHRMQPRIEMVQAFQKLQHRLWDDHSVRVQAAVKAQAALPKPILDVMPGVQAHLAKAYTLYGAIKAPVKNAGNMAASTEEHVPELPEPAIAEMTNGIQLLGRAGMQSFFEAGVLDIDGLLMVAMMKATEVETDLLRDKLLSLQQNTEQKRRLREINTKMKQETAKLDSQIRTEFNELRSSGEIHSSVKIEDYMAWRQCQYADVRDSNDKDGVPAFAWPEPKLAPLPTPLPAWLRLGPDAGVGQTGAKDPGALYGLPPSVVNMLKVVFNGLPALEKKKYGADFNSYLVTMGLQPAHTLGDVRANLKLVKEAIGAFKQDELAARTQGTAGVLTPSDLASGPLRTLINQWAAAKLLEAVHYPKLDQNGDAKKAGEPAKGRAAQLENKLAAMLGKSRHSADFEEALSKTVGEAITNVKLAAATMQKQMLDWQDKGPAAVKAWGFEYTGGRDRQDALAAVAGPALRDNVVHTDELKWDNVGGPGIGANGGDHSESEGSYWSPTGGWGKGYAIEYVDVGKDNIAHWTQKFGAPDIEPSIFGTPGWVGAIQDIQSQMGEIDPLGNLGIGDLANIGATMDALSATSMLQVLQGTGPFKLGAVDVTTDANGNHIMTDWELGKLDMGIVDKFLTDMDDPKSSFSRRLHAWGEDGDDGAPVDGTSVAADKKKAALASDGQGGVYENLGNIEGMRAYCEEIKNKLDSLSDFGELDTIRVQAAMERRSKFIDMLSNMIKKIGNLNENIVSNLK